MKKLLILCTVLLGLTHVPIVASAQSIETKVTAPNGVEVTVRIDEFSSVILYSSPRIKIGGRDLPTGSGLLKLEHYMSLAKEKDSPDITLAVSVSALYHGGRWLFYDSARFKGGDTATFHSIDRHVGDCLGYDSCMFNEVFAVLVTWEQFLKYAEDGELKIQVSGKNGAPFVISVPVSNIEAVKAVSEGKVEQ